MNNYLKEEGGGFDREWFLDRMFDKGLNIKTLSGAMGLHRESVGQSLRGKRKWQPRELGKLAEIFGVSVKEIVERTLGTALARDRQAIERGADAEAEYGRAVVDLTCEWVELVNESHIGRLCVVKAADGRVMVGEVLAAYSNGTHEFRAIGQASVRLKLLKAGRVVLGAVRG